MVVEILDLKVTYQFYDRADDCNVEDENICAFGNSEQDEAFILKEFTHLLVLGPTVLKVTFY